MALGFLSWVTGNDKKNTVVTPGTPFFYDRTTIVNDANGAPTTITYYVDDVAVYIKTFTYNATTGYLESTNFTKL